MDTAAQQALDDTEYEINSLNARVWNEFLAWTAHLTTSRKQGPHQLPAETSFKNNRAVMHELQVLMEQIAAYNVRAAATRDRKASFPNVSLDDLIAEEDVQPVSTEMSRPLLRRIIIVSRVRLHAFSHALYEQESCLTAAYFTLLIMAQSNSEILKEGKADTLCDPWSLARDLECLTLGTKAAMARLGMKVARQCVIPEFFPKVVVEEAEGGQPAGEGVVAILEQILNRDGEIVGEGDEDEKMEEKEGDGEDGDVEMHDGNEEDVEGHGSEGEADVGAERQTHITDYFTPLPKGF